MVLPHSDEFDAIKRDWVLGRTVNLHKYDPLFLNHDFVKAVVEAAVVISRSSQVSSGSLPDFVVAGLEDCANVGVRFVLNASQDVCVNLVMQGMQR